MLPIVMPDICRKLRRGQSALSIHPCLSRRLIEESPSARYKCFLRVGGEEKDVHFKLEGKSAIDWAEGVS